MSRRYERTNRHCRVQCYRPLPPQLPERLPLPKGKKLIRVFVEGYEDIAFWRGIFDRFENDRFTFEISVPLREDLAKGKKVLMKIAEQAPPDTLLCMDSDFDYLFADQTEQARIINDSPFIFHTYAYATENYLCYSPSLHNICVKATKNDARLFDFVRFFEEYSKTIYPLFVWYAYSAQINTENIFTLMDFKSSVKINYLEVEENGAATIDWLRRQVERRLASLRDRHPDIEHQFAPFVSLLASRGVTPENTYLFMQGHTLMDNVVMIVLDAVCTKLKQMTTSLINNSRKRGVALSNEQSNYNNAQYNVRETLLFNENYTDCFLYRKLEEDIRNYLDTI